MADYPSGLEEPMKIQCNTIDIFAAGCTHTHTLLLVLVLLSILYGLLKLLGVASLIRFEWGVCGSMGPAMCECLADDSCVCIGWVRSMSSQELLYSVERKTSNNTNARLMASAPSLALDPTFGIHSHKTLDTAQPCHLLKPN